MLSLTPYLGLQKLDNRDPDHLDWGTILNQNSDILDLAFGSLQYTGGAAPDGWYIHGSTPGTPITVIESQAESLDILDIATLPIANLMPTATQKSALSGEGVPAVGNKYITKSYARPDRKRVFFPEGPGNCLTGSGTGNMTANSEVHSNFTYNYYKWLSSEATFQAYDISLQWRVPDTFLNFKSGVAQALKVDICTEENATTNCKVEVILKKDGVAGTSTSGEICSSVATNWYSEREGNELVAFDDSNAVLSALIPGSILDITVRVSSKSSKYVKVGAVTILYNG